MERCPPGSEVCSPPYQLHGGVILFPAPQHHAHLTSGRRGKWGEEAGGKGGGGRSTCPRAPGRSGRPVASPSRPRPLRASPPRAASSRPRRRPPLSARGPCPQPGARAARLACLPRSLPAGLPASAKSNNSPCARAPAPRSAEAAGAATGWGRASGPPGSPPPPRPAGPPRGPGSLGWAGSPPRCVLGAEGERRKG